MLHTQQNQKMITEIPENKLYDLMLSLNGAERTFLPGEAMLLQGEENHRVFYLAEGSAHAVRVAADGREEDYAFLSRGSFFGDALAVSGTHQSPVCVMADSECHVISFPYEKLFHSELPDAQLLLRELLHSLAERFFLLQQRVNYLTRGSLREKLLAYLWDRRSEAGSDTFDIPFDREKLAAFLCCDRSGLSRELSSMRKDGLISCRKNRFTMLKGRSE